VIAVAGNISHKKVVKLIEEAMSRDGFLDVPDNTPNLRHSPKVKARGTGTVGIMRDECFYRQGVHLLLRACD